MRTGKFPAGAGANFSMMRSLTHSPRRVRDRSRDRDLRGGGDLDPSPPPVLSPGYCEPPVIFRRCSDPALVPLVSAKELPQLRSAVRDHQEHTHNARWILWQPNVLPFSTFFID